MANISHNIIDDVYTVHDLLNELDPEGKGSGLCNGESRDYVDQILTGVNLNDPHQLLRLLVLQSGLVYLYRHEQRRNR